MTARLAALALLALVAAGPPPGVVNPDVTQANIGRTICVHGWTTSIRPSVGYTNRVKREMLGLARGVDTHAYELDHFIPLELGGHPTDKRNLWPQLWTGACGAHAKDAVENDLHRRVCNRTMTLAAAQVAITQGCWGQPQ